MTPDLLSMLSESRALVFLLGLICGGTIGVLMRKLADTFGAVVQRTDVETLREIIERARRV